MARLTGLEPATPGVTGRYSNQLSYNRASRRQDRFGAAVARLTGLEPATSGVTGRHSNQLSYNRPLPARSLGRGALLSVPCALVKRRARDMRIFRSGPDFPLRTRETAPPAARSSAR